MRYAWVVGVLLAGAALSMAAQQGLPASIPFTGVKGRLQIVKPATELQVATPNDVVLKFGDYAVKHVAVSWHPMFENGGGYDSSQEEEPQVTPHSDGEAVISVHPPTLGKYELQANVDFDDNRFDVASTEVNVRLPDRNPEQFVVGDGHPIFSMDPDRISKRRVSGLALYSGYDHPVEVDAASMQFSLQTVPGQQPPVDFDPKTGEIIARSSGQAVLSVQFGGFERKACINVLQSGRGVNCPDVVPGGLKWTCEELVRPSRGPGPKCGIKPIKEQ